MERRTIADKAPGLLKTVAALVLWTGGAIAIHIELAENTGTVKGSSES